MTTQDTLLFRRGATRLIALHGGWNDRSRRAVLWLAARHGIDASEIASLLTSQEIIEHEVVPPTSVRAAAARSQPPPDRNTGVLTVLFVVSMISLVMSAGIAMIVLPGALERRSAEVQPAVGDEPVHAVDPGISTTDVASARPTPTEPEADPVERLLASVPISEVVDQLGPTLEEVAERWTELSSSQRRENRAVLVAAFERLFADTQTAPAAVNVLDAAFGPLIVESIDANDGATPADIRLALLTADIMDSLDARRFSAWVVQRLRTLRGALGADQRADGLVPAVVRASAAAIRTPADAPGAADRIERAGKAWPAWLSGVESVAGSNEKARSSLVLEGLDVLARQSPDPAKSVAATTALRLLVNALGWEAGSAERVWLTRAMLDERVSSESLYLMTGAMVTSSVPGIDATMVVPRNADVTTRRDLLSRYMVSWGMASSVEMVGFSSRWAEIAERALSRPLTQSGASPAAMLRRAVYLSGLSAAAAAASAGEYDTADSLLTVARASADAPPSSADTALSRYNPVTDESNGQWAIDFLRFESDTAGRLGMLRRAPRDPDPIDAEVLVTAALRDSVGTVRRAAAQAVRTLSDHPTIVNALLEAAPQMPRSAPNSSLVADVTYSPQVATSDPRWKVKIRLALVERLHELIGLSTNGPQIDEAQAQLAAHYTRRSGIDAASGSGDAVTEIAAVLAIWLRSNEDLRTPTQSVNDLRGRLAQRLAISRSDPQRLVANQRAVAEAMAIVIEAERPDRAERIASLMDEAAASLDEAQHVFGQIEVLEQLALALWRIRLEDS